MLRIVAELFLTFFKLGLFSFGGGYAMIPLIQNEVESHGWLTAAQFADILAIAEMTPGPIAVNTATYVGFINAGVIGGLAATAGVTMPALLLILLIARFFFKFQKHPLNQALFYGLRPTITGLVLTAAFVVSQSSLLKQTASSLSDWFSRLLQHPLQLVSPVSLLIFGLTIFLERKYKPHPLILIGGAGLAGVLLFGFLPGWA
ncbi:MAG TPA: chromate transporter [Clostridiales bacterium]|nr:chromate transporter [Clostridiales bacterium]